jgi:hypothetical protein
LVIKYRLGFDNHSDDYAYLASQILKDTNSNVIKTDNEIIIYIDGNEDEIKAAFTLLGEELPLSLYLSGQNVEEAAMMPPNRQELKEVSYLAMYPHLARGLIDERSKNYFCVGGKVVLNGAEVSGKDSLIKALYGVASALKSGKSVRIKNETSSYLLSLKQSDSVLLCNLKEPTLAGHNITVDEALSLSTMERPYILKANKNTSRFCLYSFANDALLLLLSKAATDNDIDVLYISKDVDADEELFYSDIKGDAPKRKALFFSGSDRFFLNDKFTPESLVKDGDALFFDMNISDRFGVYAVKSGVGAKKIAYASFFASNLASELKDSFEFGQKLLSNFEASFADRYERLSTLALKPGMDIENFFEAASTALGMEGGFAAIATAANGSDIAGGVKLDFVLQNENGSAYLNLKKCFASILSYKLAGVEDEILAYSIFESAVDFLILSLDEAKKSFAVSKINIGGEFLFSKAFVSKLKSKIKNVDIDMALNSLPQNLKGLYELAV